MTEPTIHIGRRQLLLGSGLGAAAAAFPGPAVAAASNRTAAHVPVRAPIVAGVDYPEHRTSARRRADREHAGRQVAALSSAQARGRVDQIIDGMRARQQRAPRAAAVPFDRYRPGGSDVLVARGELTVRVEAPGALRNAAGPDAAAELRSLGYEPAVSSLRLVADPRTMVFRGAKSTGQLAGDVATLRGRGVVAALNLVVPLGYVIKAEDYPVATTGLGPAPQAGPPAAAVRVALVDTGIAAQPRGDGWLSDVTAGPDAVDPLDVVAPLGRLDWGSGHGTFTAGIVRRVAPSCEIVSYRFCGADGLGTEKDVADALVRAAQEGAAAGVPTIVNASLGTTAVDGVPPLALRDAVEHIAAAYPQVLIVASAGNMGDTEPVYPAAFDGVVAVGALADDMQPAPFSSHGPWVRCSTVGVGVVSTFVRGIEPPEAQPGRADQVFGADPWALWTGTSFSAPQISGAVARLCGENPGLTPRSALDALLAGQPELPGYGRTVRLLPGTVHNL